MTFAPKDPCPTDPTLRARDAVEADLPAIVAIYNHAIARRDANAFLMPVTVEERRGWFQAHTPDRRPVWVACRGEEVVAWVSLSDFLPRYAYHITAEASVYVVPEEQARGIGPWLLQGMIDAAPRLGVENIVSLVFSHNLPSLKLHERLGFTRWGYLPMVTELEGNRRDVVLLGKATRIGPPG